MQKKIIVLAIASALSAPALAMAEASIYGLVDASYNFVTTGDSNNTGKGVSEQRVSSNASRIGLKGSEDLGGGLSAVWQAEGTLRFDGSGFGFDRNTFAGVSSSSMGTLAVGRIDTPYKSSTRKQDVFADSIADNRTLMGGVAGPNGVGAAFSNSWPSSTANNTAAVNSYAAFDGRNSQTLAYTSPSFSGVTVAIALVNMTASNTVDTDPKARAISMAAMYDVAPFYGTVAYESHNFSNMGGMTDTQEKAMKLGVGYSVDQFAANFVYEHTSDDIGKNGWSGPNVVGHSAMTLNGKFNISATDAVKAAYTKSGQLGDNANNWTNSGAHQISLGYDHSMSKTTTVYAIYTKLSNDTNISYSLFGGGTNSNGWDGSSPSALSLGVKHSF